MHVAMSLVPFTPTGAESVQCQLQVSSTSLRLTWDRQGALPLKHQSKAKQIPERSDHLWRTTCFECFIKHPARDSYCEWNLAPHGDWAFYTFSGYRSAPERPDCPPPQQQLNQASRWSFLIPRAPIEALLGPLAELCMQITAVTEDSAGTLRYWALAHPRLDQADFHHPAGFRSLRELLAQAALPAVENHANNGDNPFAALGPEVPMA